MNYYLVEYWLDRKWGTPYDFSIVCAENVAGAINNVIKDATSAGGITPIHHFEVTLINSGIYNENNILVR